MTSPSPPSRQVGLSDSSSEPWHPHARSSIYTFEVLCAAAAAGLTWFASSGRIAHFPTWAGLSISVAAAAGVISLIRWLPSLSYSELLKSEAILLSTVGGDVRHHWSRFSTRSADWKIHALWLRSPQVASSEDASPGSPPLLPGVAAAAAHRLPVVLLHGHSTSAAHWECVIDRLGALADVFLLDLPGWGRSPAPSALERAVDPTIIGDLHVELLEGWLKANGLSRVVLIGHSLGSFYSVLFAHAHPDRVSQLILVAPAGLTPSMPDFSMTWGIYFKYLPPQLIARTFGRIGGAVFRLLYKNNEDPRFPAHYYQLAAATAETGMADRGAGNLLKFSLFEGGVYWRLPCLSLLLACPVPVSVIIGECDQIVSPLFGPLLHRLRPLTDLYIVKKAEHNPAHSNAPAFCTAVEDCIRKQRGLQRHIAPHSRNAELRQWGVGDAALRWLADDAAAECAVVAAPAPTAAASGLAVTAAADADASATAGRMVAHAVGGVGSPIASAAPLFPSGAAAELSALPSSSQWVQSHSKDGIAGDKTPGRGHCNHCLQPVVLRKAYWRCSCAAWSFNAHAWSDGATRVRFCAMLDFLTELYVSGVFNAQTSLSLRGSVAVPVASFTGTARQVQQQQRSEVVESASDARHSHSKEIHFSPVASPFPRGDVFILL